MNDMTPKFRTNLGVIFMTILSKQDQIEIKLKVLTPIEYRRLVLR